MARRGLRTRRTRRIFTTEIAPELFRLMGIHKKAKEEIDLLLVVRVNQMTGNLIYLNPNEISETQTTSKSSRLKADRQNAPLCKTNP